ncbi:MAG: methyltransferase [Lachnospiraceae bacterium]|nr:methyltransferase [Lachnospiraceae bacterium]
MDQRITEIRAGKNVRANLIALAAEARTDAGRVSGLLEEAEDLLPPLLQSDDPKVRKNAAKLMGVCRKPGFAELLFSAYVGEETLYVRAAYLEALLNYPSAPFAEELQREKQKLLALPVTPENRKHRSEELVALTRLLKEDAVGSHNFTQEPVACDVLLTADASAKELLLERLDAEKKKMVTPGVMVRTERPWELFSCRLFKELLFFVPGLLTLPDDPYEAAKALCGAGFLKYLNRLHTGSGAFAYRVSLRGGMEEKKKAAFLKHFTGELLRLSGQRLVNLPGNYEIELRLIARREGGFRVLFKCMRLPDRRFAYRQEAVAASIHPVDAAVCMELAAPYLKEGAQVLDPFCGVGTMLVERHRRVPMGTAYAVDTFAEALEKAKRNLVRAKVGCNLIHRNFLDFRHGYLFDEIVTNLPFAVRPEDAPEIEKLYRAFFPKAAGHLKEGGVLAVYTRSSALCGDLAENSGFSLLLAKRMQEKEGTDWMIWRKS